MRVDIDSFAHGGMGIARHNGQVVFVRGALPGEKNVLVELDTDSHAQSSETSRKKFLRATAVEIPYPSPHRRAAQCPAAALGAGCCDFDFVDSEASVAVKTSVVLDQLRRIGGLDTDALSGKGVITHQALSPHTGWRTRVRFGVDHVGSIGTRKRASRQVVPVQQALCAQLHPQLADGLVEQLDRLQREGRVRPHTDIVVALADAQPSLKHSAASGAVSSGTFARARTIVEVTDAQRMPARRPKGASRGRAVRGQRNGIGRGTRRRFGNASVESVASGRTVLAGPSRIPRTLHVGNAAAGRDIQWLVPGDSFWQGHERATQAYADWIAHHVPAAPESSVIWDLYGGAGVFAAALRHGSPTAELIVVDIASPATRAGQEALGDDAEFISGDVQACLPELAHRLEAQGAGRQLHALVMDPPRTGAGAKTIALAAQANPRHVVHIACDPATGARDLKAWAEHGYEIQALHVVDGFGLTHHVELLAYLQPSLELKNGV